MRTLFRLLFIASCGLASGLAVAATSTAVEFYHGAFGHYFVTASPQEIAGLDTGVLPGWSRTGESFGVFELDTAGAANVCRFWTAQRFAPKSSHFYTPVASECAIVKGNPDWQFEGEVFALMLPDAAGGCAAGAAPLYRLYNDGKTGAPNHRYTTREAIRTEMLAQGWKAEGSGIGVTGCVPRSAEPEAITGHVIDGFIEGALVCLDANRNGRCDDGEPAGVFGRHRCLSTHDPGQRDGTARGRNHRRAVPRQRPAGNVRRRIVSDGVPVARVRHRHHAVLDAGATSPPRTTIRSRRISFAPCSGCRRSTTSA